jgi:uncharacterized protein (TIGR04255 family)
MARKAGLDRIYPNAPLTEVACEVRFPGDVSVECKRDVFWEKIRSAYPVVKVPLAQPNTAPAIQHYRFENNEGTRSVAVAINSLAFSERKYTTHRPFLVEFDRLHGLFAKSYPKLKRANRIGWRYVNAIPFVREQRVAPVAQIFRAKLGIADSLPERFRNLQLTFEVEDADGGVAVVKLFTAHDQREEVKEAFLLDLDYAYEGDLAFKDAPQILRRAHTRTRRVFEDLITDGYRAHLRGESI